MAIEFDATLLSFDNRCANSRLTLRSAAETIRDRQVPVILLDVIPNGEIDLWWNDPGFPPIGGDHKYHKGVVTSAQTFTLGQLQRSEGRELVCNTADYFAFSARINGPMRRTRFVQLFESELGAAPLRFGEFNEFLVATKREYPPFEAAHSFAPHCDSIDFGREARHWPFKLNQEQLGAWVLIQQSNNRAGFVVWDLRAESRAELDTWSKEYAATSEISATKSVRAITVRPENGQLVIFNSRFLHAVERCASTRYSIGTFLIEHDGGWKLFD